MNIYENVTIDELISRCEYWKNEFMNLAILYEKEKKRYKILKRKYDDLYMNYRRLQTGYKVDQMRFNFGDCR